MSNHYLLKQKDTPEHKKLEGKIKCTTKNTEMQNINRACHEFLHGNANMKLIVSLATTSGALYTLSEYNTKKYTKSNYLEEQTRQLQNH